ncbi:probably inactive leucine-rich repeat receptor-like protein kinase At5g06940 [Nicotiana tomentosiformis]|uniref:probably inactive leucine-rich repeat receptor-like protein kinase At5g06940 n=1 Tax=Nicotiana tomentosiformis TaxID=4098 RepID=UPI00051C5FAD|nr:probably inactive leucine-rich repeat receptor-like protein kinase At5g06940 [Nicotiana tomentosiformis]
MATLCKSSIFLLLSFSLFLLNSALDEADILLTFKDSINDPLNLLSSWSNTTTIHHCNWTGITCTSSISTINLQSLNLSGEISPSICQLPNLAHLNLANNLFNQPIPLHLSQCGSLETLNLSNNLIWGTIPEQISQFGSLKVVDFSRNHLEGRIPEGIGSLKELQVLNFGSNLLSGEVPMVLGNFTELMVLDLSQNPFLVSEIPRDIGKLSKLQKLLLQSSGFYGEIPNFFEGLKSLVILDLSQNNITGILPQVGFSLPNLVSFDVSQNKLFGAFPNGICEAKGLVDLGLHTNFFNGSIPNDSINECMNLESFQVQNNLFSGNFPSWLWSLPKIKLIRAENNRFFGEIPDSISQAAQLEQVQIDNNSFTSKIPQGLGLIRNLYRFSASLNGLYGELPPNFCDSPVMSIINLSHNYLSGKIPELKKCKKLVSLSLADNNLIGEIPKSLGALPVLTYLDLSHNNLTGEIPEELQNLKLALFNVSFNRLSGRVPASLISGLPASFLQGNPDLCGPGFPNSCSEEKATPKGVNLSKLASALISVTLALAILIIAVGFYTIRRSRKQRSEMDGWRSVFFYPLRVTENDLMMSMTHKNARGNGGTFGTVYIMNLPSGELIAVKKLMNFGSQSSKSLKTEIKTLAKIRHKNITKILGFCYSNDAIFLIYEYLASGSLGDLIGKSDFQLQWNVRLKIAIGVAQGLAYLHKDYLPHLLHRNLKSTNILLDADYEPKITDFALDRIVGEAAFKSSLASDASSSCYLAPEYGYTKRSSEQMDTYSFGVILLELITGRQAEETESGEGSLDVVKWVRRKINITNGALQVLDPKISSASQHEMLGALEIAVRCTTVMPEKRPSMFEVVRVLQCLDSRSKLITYREEQSTSSYSSVPL